LKTRTNNLGITRRVAHSDHRFAGKTALMRKKPGTKRGPKPLGDRRPFSVVYERELLEAAEELAERDNLPVGRVINRLLAEALGKPVPPYCLPKHGQQQELLVEQAS